MNYALTILGNTITGVHEGTKPFTAETFENNPRFAGQEVRVIPDRGEYRPGIDIRCYEPDGSMKPLVWCIQQGYLPLPPGKEIIDGVLVDTMVPEAEAPTRRWSIKASSRLGRSTWAKRRRREATGSMRRGFTG